MSLSRTMSGLAALGVLLSACGGVDGAAPPAPSIVLGHGVVVARGGTVFVPAPDHAVVTEIAVHVGEFVRAGTPIARLDSAEDETRAAIAATVVAQAGAELALARRRVSAGRREVDELRAAVGADAAPELDLRKALANLAELEAQASLAEIARHRAELERQASAERLERDVVRSPVAGVVSAVHARPGARVSGDPIATVEPDSGQDALVRFPEDYLGCLGPRDELQITSVVGSRSSVAGVVDSTSPIVSDAIAPDGVAERGFDAVVRLPPAAFVLGQHVVATLATARANACRGADP